MNKTIVGGLILLLVAFGAGSAWLVLAHSQPSTASLDDDLQKVRMQIKDSEIEATEYTGGAIKFCIELRREVLRSTEAMLEQKRSSLIRRINLQYVIDGKALASADQAQLGRIENDLGKAGEALAKDQAEATRYAGGLLQAVSLLAVETDRLNIAQLTLAYYSAKYGFTVPATLNTPPGSAPTPSAPGAAVKDKDAL